MRGHAVRGAARVRVPAVPRGEEQEVRRGAAHHREVPGALKSALLHPPRQVRAIGLLSSAPENHVADRVRRTSVLRDLNAILLLQTCFPNTRLRVLRWAVKFSTNHRDSNMKI